MTSLSITPNLEENPWTDLDPSQLPHNTGGLSAQITRAGIMPRGTMAGLSTVMMEIQLPSGERVIAETTLRLFRTMARGLLASPVAEAEEGM